MTKVAHALYQRLDVGKEVTKLSISKQDLINVLNTIDHINALHEDEVSINGVFLERYYIPEAFRDFIAPAAVKEDVANNASLDIRQREEVDGEILSPVDFDNIWMALMSAFKKGTYNRVSVATIRKSVSAVDYSKRMSVGGMVHYEGEAFIPFAMVKDKERMKKFYYNASVEEVVQDYIQRNMLTAIKK